MNPRWAAPILCLAGCLPAAAPEPPAQSSEVNLPDQAELDDCQSMNEVGSPGFVRVQSRALGISATVPANAKLVCDDQMLVASTDGGTFVAVRLAEEDGLAQDLLNFSGGFFDTLGDRGGEIPLEVLHAGSGRGLRCMGVPMKKSPGKTALACFGAGKDPDGNSIAVATAKFVDDDPQTDRAAVWERVIESAASWSFDGQQSATYVTGEQTCFERSNATGESTILLDAGPKAVTLPTLPEAKPLEVPRPNPSIGYARPPKTDAILFAVAEYDPRGLGAVVSDPRLEPVLPQIEVMFTQAGWTVNGREVLGRKCATAQWRVEQTTPQHGRVSGIVLMRSDGPDDAITVECWFDKEHEAAAIAECHDWLDGARRLR